ncbi:hypothetical protein C0992_008675, partial [Termitomyces sp. T32_za158]
FWALLEQKKQPEPVTEKFAMTYAMKKLELRLEDTSRESLHSYLLEELIPLLAIRVDLTFESNRDEAVLLEGLLVASSMRTVYSVPKHRQYLRGGYPSEPFLAEAAARAIFKTCRTKAMKMEPDVNVARPEDIVDKIIAIYKADIPSAVSEWFKSGLIDKGQRGELVARMLCTLAHDVAILKKISFTHHIVQDEVSFSQMIPVIDFLRALISEDHIEAILEARPRNTPGVSLKEAFKDGFVHFTHFVKAGDKETITQEAIYLLFVRGAAIQGYGNMYQVDLVIPVWIRSSDCPDRWSMTAIFIQVKNRVNKAFIFIDAQQSFEFFGQTETKEHKSRPYIALAMELGVLASEQKKAKAESGSTPAQKSRQEPKAGRKETTQTNLPTTPSKSRSTPQDPVTPSAVAIHSRELQQPTRSGANPYPSYEISITGCSKREYNVVGESSYSILLAHKDMLAEHPRQGQFLEAVRRMKPYWTAKSSYHWASMKNGSRLDLPVVQGAKVIVDEGVDDDDEIQEGVKVYEYPS